MKVTELRKIAKGMNIKPGNLRKTELIRTIQKAEGNFDCYQRANGYCDQIKCCFRDDCLKK